jgi:integrase
MGLGENGSFVGIGLSRHGWACTGPIRDIFRKGFVAAGLPYYNPHSFRAMLVRHAMTLGLSPEQMKAWRQSLGHADVLTTFTSYGSVPAQRQGDLIRAAGQAKAGDDWTQDADVQAMLKALAAKARSSG